MKKRTIVAAAAVALSMTSCGKAKHEGKELPPLATNPPIGASDIDALTSEAKKEELNRQQKVAPATKPAN